MTKWTKIEDYLDETCNRMLAERKMMTEIVSRNCQFPDCMFREGCCGFGCPFEAETLKQK